MKKIRKLPINKNNAIDNTLITNAVIKTIAMPLIIISQAYDNNGKSQTLMIIA